MPSAPLDEAGNEYHQLRHYDPPAEGAWAPVFFDEHLLIVDKPAGLLTVPGRGEHVQDCLIKRVNQHVPHALVVHRLDMATSGLVVFGLGKDMQKTMSQLFMQRQVHKCYEALVHGRPQPSGGLIDLPLIVDWAHRPRQKVDELNGKPSQTNYETIAHDAQTELTRLRLMPITGRSHQLRVHCLSIGHPIVGDTLYGPEARMPIDATSRLMLHATDLWFTHPVTHEPLQVKSHCPF